MSRSVCVALAVKNGEAYIAAAIESVLAQEGVDLSLQVIDNLSDDGSVAIAERYLSDPRVTVSVNEDDIRYYGSLNRVLERTDATYFVPFACDDVMLPGNLAAKVDALDETGAALAHSTALWMDAAGQLGAPVIDHRLTPPLSEAPGFFAQLIPHNRVICPSAVVRTETMRELGGFDGRDDFAADWLAWLRISLRAPVVTVAQPLVAYRAHAQSGTSRAERLGLRGLYEPATMAHVLEDPAFPADWSGWRDRLMAMTCAHAANGLHETGSRRVAVGFAAYLLATRALVHQPFDPEIQARFQSLVGAAGLAVPRLPFEAVTTLPETAEDGAGLLAAAEALGALLERLVIVVDPERQEDAVRTLEPLFGDASIDAVIVPTPDATAELVPGRIAIARWQAPLVAVAEGAGLPVWPYAAPDPFAQPPDPARWETLPGAAAAAGAVPRR